MAVSKTTVQPDLVCQVCKSYGSASSHASRLGPASCSTAPLSQMFPTVAVQAGSLSRTIAAHVLFTKHEQNSPLGAGEISLTGRVLPIGGIKEKTLAARRSDIKTLLFPQGNKKDWDELTGDLYIYSVYCSHLPATISSCCCCCTPCNDVQPSCKVSSYHYARCKAVLL